VHSPLPPLFHKTVRFDENSEQKEDVHAVCHYSFSQKEYNTPMTTPASPPVRRLKIIRAQGYPQIAASSVGPLTNQVSVISQEMLNLVNPIDTPYDRVYQTLSEKLAQNYLAKVVELDELKQAYFMLLKEHQTSQQVSDTIIHDSAGQVFNLGLALTHFTENKHSLSNASQEAVDSLQYTVAALSTLLKNKLLLTKILAGKVKLESVNFSVKEFKKSIFSQFHPRMAAKGLDFAVEISQSVSPYLIGDSDRLNQICSNLLANAAKFTSKGSVTLEINLVSEEDDDIVLLFSVADTGMGIPKQEQLSLGVPFQQAESSGKKKNEGTGLGLTISKLFIKMMQKPDFNTAEDPLKISSEYGKGSIFSFQACFKRGMAPPPVLKTQKILAKLENVKILFVEDNIISQQLMHKMFTTLGCLDVESSGSGEEALRVVKQTNIPFDAVFIDIGLPGIDGYETAKRINLIATERNFPTPCLIGCSGDSDINAPVDSLLTLHLQKPISKEKIHKTLFPFEMAKRASASATHIG